MLQLTAALVHRFFSNINLTMAYCFHSLWLLPSSPFSPSVFGKQGFHQTLCQPLEDCSAATSLSFATLWSKIKKKKYQETSNFKGHLIKNWSKQCQNWNTVATNYTTTLTVKSIHLKYWQSSTVTQLLHSHEIKKDWQQWN